MFSNIRGNEARTLYMWVFNIINGDKKVISLQRKIIVTLSSLCFRKACVVYDMRTKFSINI